MSTGKMERELTYMQMIALASGAVIGGWLAEAPYWFSVTGAGGALIFPLLAILLIYVCGVFDDLFNITPKQKFIFIIVASTIVYFNGYQITNIGTFFGVSLNLGYLALPFTIFAIVGFTNALNLTDGLDGLA